MTRHTLAIAVVVVVMFGGANLASAQAWQDVSHGTYNYITRAWAGSGSMSWTVEQGDLKLYRYKIEGNSMTVAWSIWQSSLSGGDPLLGLKIPANKLPAKYMGTVVSLSIEGGPTVNGYASVGFFEDEPWIYIMQVGGGLFASNSNGLTTQGEITFEIQDSGDEWNDVAYDADDFAGGFVGGNSMDWDADSGDLTTYAYRIDGNRMTVFWAVWGSTTDGGEPVLRLKIPDDRLPAGHASAPAVIYNNSTFHIGFAYVGYTEDDPWIYIRRPAADDFVADTNGLNLEGVITFEIQEEE